MIIGNLGITTQKNCVEITIGAATPARSVLFTAREIGMLCDLLNQAADKAKAAPAPVIDPFGDLL